MSDIDKKALYRAYRQSKRGKMLQSVVEFLQATKRYIDELDEEEHPIYYRFPVEEGDKDSTEIRFMVTPYLLQNLLEKELASVKKLMQAEAAHAEEVDRKLEEANDTETSQGLQ